MANIDWPKWTKLIGVSLPIFAILTTEPLYRLDVYIWSFNIIYWLQQNLTDATFKLGMQLLDVMGGTGIAFGTAVAAYLLVSRQRALYYVSSIFLLTYLVNTLKLYYQQARPYWLVDELTGYSCQNDFGSPSGHSSMSMFVTILVIMDLLATYGLDSIIISTVLCVGGAALIPLPVGFQRLWSAAHAINQIIFGWEIGAWGAFACHFSLRPFVLAHGKNLAQNTANVVTSDYISQWFNIAIYITAAMLGGVLSLYGYFDSSMTYPDAWGTRYTNWCNKTAIDYNFATLSNTGMGFIAMGSYFGMLYKSNYNLKNTALAALAPKAIFEDPTSTDWSFATLLLTVQRAVFAVVCGACVYYPIVTFSNLFTSPVYQYLFGYVLPFLAVGFSMFGLTDVILEGWTKVTKTGANPKLVSGKDGAMMELSDYKVVILQ